MLTVREKFNYLKGLADGLKLSDTTTEGKILLGVLDLLDDMSLYMEDLEDQVYDLEEYVEQIDSDLIDLEEDFYGFDSDYDYYDDYDLDDYDIDYFEDEELEEE